MYNQHKILRVLQLISLLKAAPAKSIRHLSEVLNSTERTIYRYVDLLEELGFQICRTGVNHLYIDRTDASGEMSFSADESNLLRQLLLTTGKKSKLRDSILRKLAVHSEEHLHAEHLLKAHLSKIIEQLSTAIQAGKQVTLKKYHSVNSNIISDRLVEPICFTDNYQSLAAYEIETGKNKYFNIERISAIAITNRSFAHTVKHKFAKPDVFGFSLADEQYKVDVLMSMRVSVLLKEEYPMTEPLIKREGKTDRYRFKATVNDLKPVSRFVLGFPEEITVLGSPVFKRYLEECVGRLIKNRG